MSAPPPVTLKIRWHELFGVKSGEMPATVRRARWGQWLAMADEWARDYWSDTSACEDCIHLDGVWCKFAELPATVNPYLTLKHGRGIGMACMGVGKETIGQQDLKL